MTDHAPEHYLTDEQCDEFRRLPCSFREMVREIYKSGYQKGALSSVGNERGSPVGVINPKAPPVKANS